VPNIDILMLEGGLNYIEIFVDTLEFQFTFKYQALIFLDKTGSLMALFF
jgi:hypothetical protein